MNVYIRLWSYVKPYSRFIVPFSVFTLISVFFNVFQFTMIIPLLNFLFNVHDPKSKIDVVTKPDFNWSIQYFKDLGAYLKYEVALTNPTTVLYALGLVIVLAVVFNNLFRYLAQRTLLNARTLLVKRLREALFSKINHLHIGYFTKEHKGDLLSRMNGDVYVIEGVAANSIEIIFKEPMMLIGYFITLFAISVKLTLFTLVIIPISAVGISLVTKRLKREAGAVQASMGRMLTIIDETLSGMRIIRSFNATPYTLKKFEEENDIYRKTSVETFKRKELAPAFSEASGVLVVACILVYGGSLILNGTGDLSASAFIAFLAMFSQVTRPAKAVVVAITNIQHGKPSAERILEILDRKIEVDDKPDAIDMPTFHDKIELKNVNFSYGEKPVLKNINLTIPKGKKVALVGPSGVGKSTIADLVPRFYDATSGAVIIDGMDVRDVKMESLRRNMSFVSQEIILFNDTIFNNIALGYPDAKLEDVIHAAKVANAHDFIEHTEHGYYTNIGDRGVRLSGGQRQRLSIARAVFKNAPILLLDEATSALDTESEKVVQDALDNLMEGRTTLVIAHRLSTIKEADEIIIMQDGEIIERGTHSDLVEVEEGVYRRLTQLQNIS